MIQKEKDPEMLCRSEVDSLKQLMSLLKPFEYVNREASAENYITISKIIPTVSFLIIQLQHLLVANSMKVVQQNLLNEVNKRFEPIEMNTHIVIGTLLDPRFKSIHFRDPSGYGRAIQKLKDIIKFNSVVTSSESEEEQSVFDFWEHHNQHACNKKKNKCNKEHGELSSYLNGSVAI